MPTTAAPFRDRVDIVFNKARARYEQQPPWETFFAEILGEGGVARQEFGEWADFTQFTATEQYQEIQRMIADLRQGSRKNTGDQAVVTVRLPKAVHEFLREEAHQRRISLNLLCVTKLLQAIQE